MTKYNEAYSSTVRQFWSDFLDEVSEGLTLKVLRRGKTDVIIITESEYVSLRQSNKSARPLKVVLKKQVNSSQEKVYHQTI